MLSECHPTATDLCSSGDHAEVGEAASSKTLLMFVKYSPFVPAENEYECIKLEWLKQTICLGSLKNEDNLLCSCCGVGQ